MRIFHPFSPLTRLALCAAALTLPACKNGAPLSFKKKEKADAAQTEAAPAEAPASAAPAVTRSPQEEAFLQQCAALASAPGGVVAGKDGWFFSGAELQRLVDLSGENPASIRAAVGAITDYSDQLKRRGIELVLVPVPPKAVIYPDKLSKDLKLKVRRGKAPRLDSALQNTWSLLRSRGVRVIDVTDALLAEREDKKAGPAFPKTGAVWAPRGAEIAARAIAREFRDAPWANQPGKDGAMTTEATTLTYAGPLGLAANAPAEVLGVRNVGRAADGKMRSVTFSQGGKPLALMGDGVILAWRENNNPPGSPGAFASLADQLAYELQVTPDVFPGKAEGRNAPRLRVMRDGTNGRNTLGSAKTVLWIVPATDLASRDWRRVPLKLEFNLTQPDVQLESSSGGITPAPPQRSAEPEPVDVGEPEDLPAGDDPPLPQ